MLREKEKTKLLVGFHSHLPFNALNHSNGSTSNHSKFINDLTNLVTDNSNLKLTFHLSSNLIIYLDKNFSDFSHKVRDLLDSNRLELFTGGIYEPFFPCIPREDRQTQIILMSRLLNHIYGYEPYGMWIPGSMWEPSLALDIAKARVQYTCLSKEYFLNAGIKDEDISGYYITEDEGRKIAIFPVTFYLDNLIEKYSPNECINLLTTGIKNSIPNNCCTVVIFNGAILDENKFLWIKDFFQNLSTNNLIETSLFNEYFLKNRPKGRIYLPSLQNKQILLGHHEVNLLHKKMLRVSKKINSAKEGKSRFKVIKEMITQAQELLLKGQSNDTYKDSPLIGIYSPEERHNSYTNLIKAENLIDAASRQDSKWVQLSEIDYDCDGNDEIIVETETQNIYISPALGGTILEHDYRPKNINITNTISRRTEEAHQRTEDREQRSDDFAQNGEPIYGNHLKLNLIEHFLDSNLSLEKCKLGQLNHLTKEVITSYQAEKIKAKEETCKVTLKAIRDLILYENIQPIELIKEISVRAGDSSMMIDYTLTNQSISTVNLLFAVEFNLNLSPKQKIEPYIFLDGNPEDKTPNQNLKSPEGSKEANQILIRDKGFGIDLSLSWDKSCNLFSYPIETLSFNLEKIFQGTTIFPTWLVNLEPNLPWKLNIKQDIKTLQSYED